MRVWFEHRGQPILCTDWFDGSELQRSVAFVEVPAWELGLDLVGSADARYYREAPSVAVDQALRAGPAVEPPAPSAGPEPVREEPEDRAWVQIELVDSDGEPVADELCKLTLADGKTVERTTDRVGGVRLDGIKPGKVTVTFPRLGDAWKVQ